MLCGTSRKAVLSLGKELFVHKEAPGILIWAEPGRLCSQAPPEPLNSDSNIHTDHNSIVQPHSPVNESLTLMQKA